jgi:SIR2-like domain
VPLSTGIEDMENGTLVDWPEEGVRLMKLHGSVDWAWHDAQVEDGYLPFDYVGSVESPDDRVARPAMIFGQRGKLRAEGPFLTLFAEFEEQLARCNHLISIGYSFRDDHVNEVLRRWIDEDIGRKVTVVDPSWPDGMDWRGDFREMMNCYLVPGSWMAEPDFESRLTVRRNPVRSSCRVTDASPAAPQER